MPTPLTEKEVLASISPIFHAEYAWLKDAYLQRDEPVFAAADRGGGAFGYVVITSYRLLDTWYRSGEWFGRAKTRIYKERRGVFFDENVVFNWFDLTAALSKQEIKTREVKEFRLNQFTEDLERREYAIKFAGQRLELMELREVGWGYRFMFKAESGKMIYDLIQTAAQNQDRIPTEEAAPNNSIPGLIEALGRLRQAGVLTDQEFEQKKKELLNRL